MLNMERYFDKHVKLEIVVDNEVYQMQGKIIGATEHIVKLETYKHRKVNHRYLNPKDIVSVEDITNY
ncbi:tape measure chaperone [Bacillus phage vB_BcgM]|nr:tape measure chaperone [Bacillus phage vB_BcgM]